MPRYEITSPDGRRFEINAPDGATQDQVMAYAQQNFGSPAPKQEKEKSWGDALMGDAQNAGILRTAFDQGLQGLTFNFMDEAQDRIGAGIASLATGENYSDLLEDARDMSKKRMARQMEQRPALSIGSNVVGGALAFGAGGATKQGANLANSLRAGGTAARIGKGALAGAASGAAYGAGGAEDGELLQGAFDGALYGAIGGGIVPGIGAAASSVAKGAKTAARGVVARTGDQLKEHSGQLKSTAVAARNQMKGLNARINTSAAGKLAANLENKLADVDIIDELAPKSTAILRRIREQSKDGIDLNRLDQYRRLLRMARDEDSAVAGAIRSALDDTVNGLKASDFDGVGGKEAVGLLNKFRKQYAQASKFEDIADILVRADGDPNKIKSGLTRFLTNDDNLRGWDKAEIEALKFAARSTVPEKALKMFGKFGIDLGTSLTPGNTVAPLVGGALGSPVVPVIGTAARYGQKAMARGKAEQLLRTIEGVTPEQMQRNAAQAMQPFRGGSDLGKRILENPNMTLYEAAGMAKPKADVRGMLPFLGGAMGAGVASDAGGGEVSEDPTQIYVNPNMNPYQGGEQAMPEVELPQGVPVSQQGDAAYLDRVAMAESGGNANAQNPNSSASGLMGFTNDTWMRTVAKYGKKHGISLRDKANPDAQRIMAAELARDNANYMRNKLGAGITVGDLYVAHFFGAPDAVKLIQAQGSGKYGISMYSPKIVKANMPIFFDRSRPRTVEEIYDLLQSKVA